MQVRNCPLGTPEKKLLGVLVANGKWKTWKGREVMDAMEEEGHITQRNLLVNKQSCLICDLKLQSIKKQEDTWLHCGIFRA